MLKCAASSCERTNVNKTLGLCLAHAQRLRRGAPLDTPILDRRKVEWPICNVEGCARKAESKTGTRSKFCPVHTNQLRRGTEPGIYRVQGQYGVCQLPGCDKPFRSNQLCSSHDARRKNYNLSVRDFMNLMQSPCAICGSTDIKRASIDHDHSCCPGEKSCGKCVRGRLCKSCNLGLGAFRDRIDLLQAAVLYLSAKME